MSLFELLTDQCKEYFEKFLDVEMGNDPKLYNVIHKFVFSDLPNECQWGVLVKYFDKRGYRIFECPQYMGEGFKCNIQTIGSGYFDTKRLRTREEARKMALAYSNRSVNYDLK